MLINSKALHWLEISRNFSSLHLFVRLICSGNPRAPKMLDRLRFFAADLDLFLKEKLRAEMVQADEHYTALALLCEDEEKPRDIRETFNREFGRRKPELSGLGIEVRDGMDVFEIIRLAICAAVPEGVVLEKLNKKKLRILEDFLELLDATAEEQAALAHECPDDECFAIPA